jgi:hypothetical protein
MHLLRSPIQRIRWLERDQDLLSYIFSLVTREVLMGITTVASSAAAWNTLEDMYGSHTRARPVNTRIALATTKKGTSTMAEYFSKMKSFADELVAFGHTLGDDEFTAYVLTGLDEEFYNPLVSSIVTQVEPITISELYSQMLSYEVRVDKQSDDNYSSSHSTNAASRGRGTPWPT